MQDIGILPAILEAADQGKRVIVITSDHGHIPELENTKAIERQSQGEARFRHGEVSDECERKFSGRRIEAAIGTPSIILPITETLRYGQKAAGYHGGPRSEGRAVVGGKFNPLVEPLQSEVGDPAR
ncbi:MAG: hypothetical protein WCK77_22240 [Verrucomicrobiota bacterium]